MIIITQSCDNCHSSRELENVTEQDRGGWRQVRENKHLCTTCINALVK